MSSIPLLTKTIDDLKQWLELNHNLHSYETSQQITDPVKLHQLALKYKGFLIELKERQTIIKTLKTSLKELSHSLPVAQVETFRQEIENVQRRWSSTCLRAKKEHSKLSLALKNASIREISPFNISSSDSESNSRHTTPEKVLRNAQFDTENKDTCPLDSLLESMRLEAERQFDSLNTELDALSDREAHKPPPLPKPSVLGNAHRSPTDKNNLTQPVLLAKDTTNPNQRHNNSLVNGNSQLIAPVHPPLAVPKQKKAPLKENNSCPTFQNEVPPMRRMHSVVQIRPLTNMDARNCRIAQKIGVIMEFLKKVDSILVLTYSCELQSVKIDERISDVKGALALLDIRVDELKTLVQESEMFLKSTKTNSLICMTYTHLEYSCCVDSLPQVYSKALNAQTMANEEISHLELVKGAILKFEYMGIDCRDSLCQYEKVVTELRNGMLEGKMSNQPWTSACQSLNASQTYEKMHNDLLKLSNQLLSLEPKFNGQPIKEQVKSLEDSFQALQVDASVVIHSAVSHRLKFAKETCKIFDDWLQRVDTQVLAVQQGLLSGLTMEVKQNLCQQSTENIQTLLLTTEQLQCILNLASDSRSGISNQQQVLSVQSELTERKTRLEAACRKIIELKICEKTQQLSSVTKQSASSFVDSTNKTNTGSYTNNTATLQPPKKTLLYTEIEAKGTYSSSSVKISPPMLRKPVQAPPPVYTEVIIPPRQIMDYIDGPQRNETFSSKESTPIPRSLSPSVSPSRTVLHGSSSPERNRLSTTDSPSPPPPSRPHKLIIQESQFMKATSPKLSEQYDDTDSENSIGVNVYDVPRSHSVQTTLLMYIKDEYSVLAEEANIDEGFQTPDLKETVSLLSVDQGKKECDEFLDKLGKLRELLMTVKHDISNIQVPYDIHVKSLLDEEMQKCNILKEMLVSASALLSQYNYNSSTIHAVLAKNPVSSANKVDTTTLNSLILQLELELFDLGCLYHNCQSQLREKIQTLKDAEGTFSNLCSDLELLTNILDEANNLLSLKDSIVDVDKYLSQCQEMHIKLTDHANRRKNVASKIRELILNTAARKDSLPADLSYTQPSSHVFKLLEQLKSIETQWVNVTHSLMNMSQLEPILLKNMMTNIAKEIKALENVYSVVECDILNLDEITEKFSFCEKRLEKLKEMRSSLSTVKPRIEQLQEHQSKNAENPTSSTATNEAYRKHDGPIKSASLDRSLTHSTIRSSASSDDDSMLLPLKRRSIGAFQCEASFDYILLTKSVLTLSGLLERAVNELDAKYMALYQRKLILEKFWNESKIVSTWIRDTVHSLQSNNGIASEPQLLLEQTVSKKTQLSELQDAAKQILGISAPQAERKAIKDSMEKVTRGWAGLYKLLPLDMQVTIQPSQDTLTHLKPPDSFEDASQMIEWLILMESKLQPHPLIVGNTAQVRTALDGIEAMKNELQVKTPECQKFIKQNQRHTVDYNDSDSSTSSGSTSSHSKTVKFIDENTLQRIHRKKQIKQDIVLDTILSEDELDSDDSIDSDSSTGHGGQQSVPSQRTHISSPLWSPASIEETSQQLSTLWNGVWGLLSQRKQSLESVLDIWNSFESKKAALELFILHCDEQREELMKKIEHPKSVAAIGKEIVKLKDYCDEMTLHQQKMGTLNDLTSDLIQRHKQIDNVNELQESMSLLNKKWRKAHENYLRIKPLIDAIVSTWNSFSDVYQPFKDLVEESAKKLTKINENVIELGLLQNALDETEELFSMISLKSGNVGMIKQLNIKLQETIIWSVVDNEVAKLENRWQSISNGVNEKKAMLEHALTERKDILSVYYRCETWCRHAKDHIQGQKPLTADVSILNAKIDVNNEFQKEISEKLTQLSLCYARAKHISADFTLPNSLMHNTAAEDVKAMFLNLQSKLKELDVQATEWRQLMEGTLSIMSEFQQLANKFQTMLVELSASLPGAFQSQVTLPGLRQQLEKWQSIENTNNVLSKGLEAMVSSQKKLLEMGAQASPDAVQLVKKFHKQWNVLKRSVDTNIDSIKKSIWKLDPSNLEMTLPRGWTKALTAQGTPYYIDTLSGNHTQWQHPELSELYRSFTNKPKYTCFPSPAYPISLYLRNIQKCIHVGYVPTEIAMDTFDMYKLNHNETTKLSPNEMTEIVLSVYQRVMSDATAEDPIDVYSGVTDLNVNRAVELTVSWIQDVFDITHGGSINVLAFEVALISLSTTKMEDKHKALFQVATNGKTTMDMETMRKYLEVLLQIPQSVSDVQYCSLDFLDKSVQDCFKKFATGESLHSVGYLAWAQEEPLPISWLPILHRMAAAETMKHGVKCSVCRDSSITGFRYKCMQCQNFNMCQDCYWSGKTAKEHDRTKHFMEEYCISSDEKGLFFRTLGNRGKKRSISKTPPRDSPGPLTPTQNKLSLQYEKDRIQQLKHHLSNPNRKNSSPEYYSLSLRRDLPSSLLHSSKSEMPNKRNSNSFSNLTNEYPQNGMDDFTSSNYEKQPQKTLPHSRSFDPDLGLAISSSPPPPVPIKASVGGWENGQTQSAGRNQSNTRGISGHYDSLALQ